MAIAEPPPSLTEDDLTTIEVYASRLVGNFGFTFQDREDIQQDLALDLLERLPRFDAAKAKRSTFVKRCIENRISTMIRASGCQCRDHRRLISINDDQEDERRELVEATGHVVAESDRLALRVDMESVIRSLPARERQVCELLPLHSPFAISKLLGRSKQEIYTAVRAIRKAFAAAGLTPSAI